MLILQKIISCNIKNRSNYMFFSLMQVKGPVDLQFVTAAVLAKRFVCRAYFTSFLKTTTEHFHQFKSRSLNHQQKIIMYINKQ